MLVCSSIIVGSLIFMFIYNSIDAFLSFSVLLYNSIVISLVLVFFWVVFVSFHSLCVCMFFFSMFACSSINNFFPFSLFYNFIINDLFFLMLEFIIATPSTPFFFVCFFIFHHWFSPSVFIYRSINVFLLFFALLQFHCRQSFPLNACESTTPLVHFFKNSFSVFVNVFQQNITHKFF